MAQGHETVAKVFSRDKFSIPQYQRDYAWKRQNFIDLWEDLEEAIESKDSQGHFLGTIVVAPNKDDSDKFDIIDGQQRTTTIFMLLYALVSKSENKENLKTKFLLNENGELKLEIAPQNQEFFKKLLKQAEKDGNENVKLQDEADTQGKKNLYEVFQSILDKVAKLNASDIKTYVDSLKNMILMWLEEPNSGRAIRTFQSVNDRGVPLNLLDKLKSLLIYYSNRYCNGIEKTLDFKGQKISLDEKINNDFGDMFKTILKIEEHKYISSIGNQQFSESDIFRYHAGSIKFDGVGFLGHYRRSSENTYIELKNKLKVLVKDCVGLSNFKKLEDFLIFYTNDLKKFYESFLGLLDEIDTNTQIFKLVLLGKINPYFYNSLLRLKINNELDDEMISLFSKADILFFKSSSSRDATAFNLIDSYLKNGSKQDLKNQIVKETQKLDIERVVDDLVKYAYEMNSFHLIFFEQNYKNMDIAMLKSLIEKKELTQEKEHIIPENILEKEDESKAKQLGFDDLEDLGNHIDNYGNLLSLEKSLNAKAKDRDLLEKEQIYQDSKIPFIRQFDANNFNKKILRERNEELRNWLKNEFFKDFLA